MWDKAFRAIVFTVIYQRLYWGSDFSWDIVEIDDLSIIHGAELTVEQHSDIKSIFDFFELNQEGLSLELQVFVRSWDKTFDIVKAVLFTAMLEKKDLQLTNTETKKLIAKYISLTQDMIGGNNPALVHAVLGKVFGTNQSEDDSKPLESITSE